MSSFPSTCRRQSRPPGVSSGGFGPPACRLSRACLSRRRESARTGTKPSHAPARPVPKPSLWGPTNAPEPHSSAAIPRQGWPGAGLGGCTPGLRRRRVRSARAVCRTAAAEMVEMRVCGGGLTQPRRRGVGKLPSCSTLRQGSAPAQAEGRGGDHVCVVPKIDQVRRSAMAMLEAWSSAGERETGAAAPLASRLRRHAHEIATLVPPHAAAMPRPSNGRDATAGACARRTEGGNAECATRWASRPTLHPRPR